jgi:hypothetical protein
MTRQQRWTAWALAGAIAVGASGLAWRHFNAPAPEEAASSSEGTTPWLSQTLPGTNNTATRIASHLGASGAEPAAPFNPLEHMVPPTFKAKPDGTLAMVPQTRVDVERVYALYSRDEALAKLEAFSQGLPDPARRELKDLFQQYAQYAQAVTQTYPPGLNLNTVDDAARQLDGLHDLRQQYFGAERAEALFGEEEKASRELMVLMRQQNTPGLSLEDKATQAQSAWKKTHPEQP